jgi:hypothetical protein
VTPEARTDYIVRCLTGVMHEDDAKAFLAEHDADVLHQAADLMDAHYTHTGADALRLKAEEARP